MSAKSGFSTNPEDYKFRSVARKSDEQGREYWSMLGAIVVPLEVDTQKEASDYPDIQAQAWEWFMSGRTAVDINHSYKDVPDIIPVESYIARKDDPDFKPGTWAIRSITYNPEYGKKIDNGELNAYSWAGPVNRERSVALVSHPLEASGTTEKSDAGPYPEHDHPIENLRFGDDAKVVPTITGIAFGHEHHIVGTTRTEPKDGHSHGLLIQAGE
jgi:hypothetical protein